MFASINEKGEVFDQNLKSITDPDVLEEFFYELKVKDNFQITSLLHGEPVIVEAYDEPLIVSEIELGPTEHTLVVSPGFEWNFKLESLTLDAWDRFHGLTNSGIPFVLNREAQNQFFDQLEDFDDDTICYDGKTHEIPSYWSSNREVETGPFWTNKYNLGEAGWDLGQPAAGLKALLPKLKLPHSRVLVLGGGKGHDAAYFAEQGHRVTLIDISPSAIAEARKLYGHLDNLKFIEADLFTLPDSFNGQFDLIFEHTCFCAINPTQRGPLVGLWRRLLSENGQLMGVFFSMPKRTGPPFGGSEWELKKLFEKRFHPLIWQRIRYSIEPRQGRELLVLANKIP